MNYRHIFHAGNFADVFKHLLLARALEYFKQKDKPYFVLDTHGGIGYYDLQGDEAIRTAEAEQGIVRFAEQAANEPLARHYLKIVDSLNASEDNLRYYPGSPVITSEFLRDNDRLVVCELHKEDAETLKQTPLGKNKQVQILAPVDGYQAMRAQLPPRQKRGLVLIDPPFENTSEFDDVVSALKHGLKRWQSGSFAVWYPIKDELKTAAFHRDVAAVTGMPKTLIIELNIRTNDERKGLHGCGFLWVNPPFGVVQDSEQLLPFLCKILAQDKGANFHSRWLVSE
ncbi:23S rRNA (adenine(2030)-N(6))-methyltransferase RlmJ [Idiomarina ramblicola]|uniref:Ribosomal RNA large subunit methyltransferase J n=1 Tax=Idiomarina ramblicola TaxID=263724 RepID=A0A432YUS8_9GAMM|nr:23S rRNA (adenine(2030)-N(6))-methyltransferase RlmJ [Idiomarina ramblicola]RUO67067.1 23S rRNA (adenine(2030)-N(6))-methyltransferase RlmJ [Idiomarina ramblicola]